MQNMKMMLSGKTFYKAGGSWNIPRTTVGWYRGYNKFGLIQQDESLT